MVGTFLVRRNSSPRTSITTDVTWFIRRGELLSVLPSGRVLLDRSVPGGPLKRLEEMPEILRTSRHFRRRPPQQRNRPRLMSRNRPYLRPGITDSCDCRRGRSDRTARPGHRQKKPADGNLVQEKIRYLLRFGRGLGGHPCVVGEEQFQACFLVLEDAWCAEGGVHGFVEGTVGSQEFR